MNKYEKSIVEAIEKTGCHYTSVFDPEEQNPTYSYTTGLFKSYGAPEIIIMGLRPEIIPSIFDYYKHRVQQKKVHEPGQFYEGFLGGGFEVAFDEVSQSAKEEYMLSACWYNKNCEFPALQLIYPTTSGVWPWEEDASDYFREVQLCLSDY